MIRFITVFLLLTISVFGAGICDCQPGISGTVTVGQCGDEHIGHPRALTRTTLPNGAGYMMDLLINDPAFLLQLHVDANHDPAIGFGMFISGDPIVDITLTQVFLGVLTDAYIKTTVFGDGRPVTQQIDLNCAFAGQPLYSSVSVPCLSPSSVALQALNFGPAAGGLLQVQIHFNLSDFDTVTMNGSSIISAEEVPEPDTGALFAAGFLAIAGVALRRKRA